MKSKSGYERNGGSFVAFQFRISHTEGQVCIGSACCSYQLQKIRNLAFFTFLFLAKFNFLCNKPFSVFCDECSFARKPLGKKKRLFPRTFLCLIYQNPGQANIVASVFVPAITRRCRVSCLGRGDKDIWADVLESDLSPDISS